MAFYDGQANTFKTYLWCEQNIGEAPLLQFYVCLFEEYLKSGISVVDIIDVLLAGVEYISMSRWSAAEGI